jgi:acyl-CoA reductase-like NAD-dependent aldehyde dehydrogenase
MKMFVKGEWVDSNTGETMKVLNPATTEVVDSVPKGGAEDVSRAVDAAYDAYKKWSGVPSIERSRILLKVAETTRSMVNELAVSLTREQGKPLSESKGEVSATAGYFEYYAALAGRIRGGQMPLANGEGFYIVQKQPIGVVGAILPWNFPVSLMSWKVAPGLAAGNTFVVKPASSTPLTTLMFGDVFNKSGVPPGVVNIVTGPGGDVGEAMLSSKKIRKIAFTGETGTGRRIMTGAAKDMKRVTLELGGSDPMVVFDDADMALAVEGAAWGRYRNAGQSCTAVKRLFLQESIAPEFMKHFIEKVKTIKIGSGLDPHVSMGPLHNPQQRDSVESMVEDATSRGAKVMLGGKRPAAGEFSRGYFYEPTILANTDHDAVISREECFGPALPIFTFKDESEALTYANDTIYGLGSSVWSKDLEKAYRVAERIEAGTTWINSPPLARAEVPFGGFKQSGIGRELGIEGLEHYEETKSIHVYDYTKGKKWAFPVQ